MAQAKKTFNESAASPSPNQNIIRSFFTAIEKDDVNLLAAILKKYPDAISWQIKTADDNALNALIFATKNRRINAVSLLLMAGMQPDAANVNGSTALMYAAAIGSVPLIEKLLDAGSNIDAQNKQGTTALIMASALGQQNVIAFLLEKGANTELADNDQASAITHAHQNGHSSCAALIERAVRERAQAAKERFAQAEKERAAEEERQKTDTKKGDGGRAIKKLAQRMIDANLT